MANNVFDHLGTQGIVVPPFSGSFVLHWPHGLWIAAALHQSTDLAWFGQQLVGLLDA